MKLSIDAEKGMKVIPLPVNHFAVALQNTGSLINTSLHHILFMNDFAISMAYFIYVEISCFNHREVTLISDKQKRRWYFANCISQPRHLGCSSSSSYLLFPPLFLIPE